MNGHRLGLSRERMLFIYTFIYFYISDFTSSFLARFNIEKFFFSMFPFERIRIKNETGRFYANFSNRLISTLIIPVGDLFFHAFAISGVRRCPRNGIIKGVSLREIFSSPLFLSINNRVFRRWVEGGRRREDTSTLGHRYFEYLRNRMSDPRLGESFLRMATVRGEGKRG